MRKDLSVDCNTVELIEYLWTIKYLTLRMNFVLSYIQKNIFICLNLNKNYSEVPVVFSEY